MTTSTVLQRSIIPSLLFLLVACAGKNNNDLRILREANNGLEASNRVIRINGEIAYRALIRKAAEPITAYRATTWLPRVEKVLQLRDSMAFYIKSIRQQLVEEAGFDPFDSSASSSGEGAVTHVFIEHKEGQLLHEKLALYKRDLLAIDSSVYEVFNNKLAISGAEQVTTVDAFTKTYFNGSLAEAIMMLNKIENDVLITGNRVIDFCNEHVGSMAGHGFYLPSVIISQSTSIATPGETINITAGLGFFNTEGKPVITIGGKILPITVNGHAEADIKAGEIGKHTIPVTIEYTDQYGEKQQVQKTVEYRVKPAQ